MPFPTREGGDQADANHALAGRRKTRSSVDIERHAIRREAREVDGIPDRADRGQRSAQRPQIVGDTPRGSNDRRTARARTVSARCAQRPAGDVVVNVPDEQACPRAWPTYRAGASSARWYGRSPARDREWHCGADAGSATPARRPTRSVPPSSGAAICDSARPIRQAVRGPSGTAARAPRRPARARAKPAGHRRPRSRRGPTTGAPRTGRR